MSKLKFSKGRFSRFVSSKGFYVALGVCLLGASVATWVSMNRTINGIESNNSQIIESENSSFRDPILEEVENNISDMPKTFSPPASSSSTQSSLQEQSQDASNQQDSSEKPVSSDNLQVLDYALPVRGTIYNSFSGGELIKNTTLNDWRTHDGIDIACEQGAEILSAADGVVESVDNDPLWGGVIVISHPDGNQTIYAGLETNFSVSTGDTVTAKQSIGRLDGVPCEINEQSHIHFAMKSNGKYIDPLSVIT